MIGWMILAFALDPVESGRVVDAEVRRHVGTVRLDIPDQIAPALAPYVACRFASRGIPIQWQGGDPTPPGVGLGGDCSSHREAAARSALRMLEGHGGRAQREALVAAALANIDQFVERAPAPATR